jgi:hypothetical protein
MEQLQRRNKAEARFEQWAKEQGWESTKRGWPDFMLSKDGRIIAVEVKPRYGKRPLFLKQSQVECMEFLSSHGIECFVSDGYHLEPFDKVKHTMPMGYKYRREG